MAVFIAVLRLIMDLHVPVMEEGCITFQKMENNIPPSEMKEPTLLKLDRDTILRKAYTYKDTHPDEFVRVLAQIAIYHYGD